jgi:hypothetical protein
MRISNLLRRACCAILPGTVMAPVSPMVEGAMPAGAADAVAVRTTRDATGLFSFAVTVRSRGIGCNHHAECLEVAGPYSQTVGPRILEHPHKGEQPFTCSIPGVRTQGAVRVTVRMRFKAGGFDGATKAATILADAS